MTSSYFNSIYCYKKGQITTKHLMWIEINIFSSHQSCHESWSSDCTALWCGFCVRSAALSSSPVFGSHLHRSPRGKKFNIVDGSAPLPCFSYLDPDIWRKYSFALRKHRHFPVVLGYVYLSWDPLPQCGWKCHIMHTHWNPGNPHLCWVFPMIQFGIADFRPKKNASAPLIVPSS